MDNLSYNAKERLLVANELKLGSKKNQDQLLKYSLMYSLLVKRGFIPERTRFLLLFIGDKSENSNWQDAINSEIKYCEQSSKSTSKMCIQPEIIKLAKNAEYATTTWDDLIQFNKKYMKTLSLPNQQVEHKLLWGFNQTLESKAFMNNN